MIKNLVTNGCSFTQDQQEWIHDPNNTFKAWPNYIAENLQVENYKNLAMGGAGNNYICDSTIEYLHTAKFNPSETLVVIMWSGISRVDLMMSKEYADLFRTTYNFIPQHAYPLDRGYDNVHYLLSGGHVGSWLENRDIRQVLHPIYRISDQATLCKRSLLNFVNLRNYLKVNGYKFKFTSFINYWNKSILDYKEAELQFGNDKYSLLQDFDFLDWFFIDDQRNSFGEYAAKMSSIADDNHPLGPAHKAFANEIIMDAIKELV